MGREHANRPAHGSGLWHDPRMDDAQYMAEAVALSRKALADDGGHFGAVIVKDGVIVGRGRNRVTARRDPTAHAEVLAVRDACQTLDTHDLSGCTAYATSEPCPMCLGALLWARVSKVIYAVSTSGAAAAGFDDVRFYEQMRGDADDRDLAMVHQPDEEARRVIEAWAQRPDRKPY